MIDFVSEDIADPVEWRVHDPGHFLVVHLGGQMRSLETDLEGHGGSIGPALPGEVWTVPEGRSYSGYACGGVIRFAEIRIDSKTFGEMKPLAGMVDPTLLGMLGHLERSLQAGADESQANATGEALLLRLGRFCGDAGHLAAAGASLHARVSKRLREYIHENLSEPLSLESLSLIAGMSSHRLLEAFRNSFGESPWQYVIRQRLRLAARLLLDTHEGVTGIALESGFSSHSHLTSSFTRHFGVSPSRYRSGLRN